MVAGGEEREAENLKNLSSKRQVLYSPTSMRKGMRTEWMAGGRTDGHRRRGRTEGKRKHGKEGWREGGKEGTKKGKIEEGMEGRKEDEKEDEKRTRRLVFLFINLLLSSC